MGRSIFNSYSLTGALNDNLLLGASVSDGQLADIYGRYNIGENVYFLFGQKRFYSKTVTSTSTQISTSTGTIIVLGNPVTVYNTNTNTDTDTAVCTTENKLFYGIGGKLPLTDKLSGHAFIAGDSVYREGAVGVDCEINKAVSLHIVLISITSRMEAMYPT